MNIQLNSSRFLTGLLSILFAGAILCIQLITVPFLLKVAMDLVCAGVGIQMIRKHAIRHDKRAMVFLSKLSGREWVFKTKEGRVRSGILKEAWMSQKAMILNFKIPDQYFKESVVICQDAVLEADFYDLKRQFIDSY